MSSEETPPTKHAHDYLSFCVGEQDFCLNIRHVREIRSKSPFTPLPHAPNYMRGVINLRGTVLPIMDLACRLGMIEAPDNPRSVIIVVQGGAGLIGLLVSAVSDILSISMSDLKPLPVQTDQNGIPFLQALALLERGLIKLLNLEAVLSASSNQPTDDLHSTA
jgi:purine-binding chemotaxis protein CheW